VIVPTFDAAPVRKNLLCNEEVRASGRCNPSVDFCHAELNTKDFSSAVQQIVGFPG